MIGKLAKVRRWVSMCMVGGREVWTVATAELTRCSVSNISTFQLKYRSISADPRLVMDWTVCNPCTLLMACSNGCVMVTIIWSMGITPLSTPTMMRGKLVEGNTDTGMLNARYPPTNARMRMRKTIDF